MALAKNLKIRLMVVTSFALVGCELAQNNLAITKAPSTASATVTKINPIAAKPGDVVQVSGDNFSEAKQLKVKFGLSNSQISDVPLAIVDRQNASFVMPEGVGLGLRDVKLIEGTGNEVASFSLVANQTSNTLPIFIGEASDICSDKQYIDRNGDTQTGTKNCAGVTIPDCSSNGQQDCVASGVYSAAAECASNGAVGCMTTSTYKSADLTNLTAGNIKKDISIAGVDGEVEPAPVVCNTNGQQDCVAAGSFFAGSSCAANGSNCFLPSYAMSAAPLKAIDVDSIDSWNIRAGTAIGGVSGKLKYSCRNRVDTENGDFNYDNPGTFNIGRSYIGSGTVVDIWDTISDSNNFYPGLPKGIVPAWGDVTDCGGVEVSAGDGGVWKDVTSNGCASGSQCVMFDKISRLEWASTSATAMAWDNAWAYCINLTWDGKTGWRLPTQKETFEAYNHGIRDAARTSWINSSILDFDQFWSGTTIAGDGGNAWGIVFGQGYPVEKSKGSTARAACVR